MLSVPALLGRKSGVLQVHSNALVFVADDNPEQLINLRFENILINVGGENSTYYFIKAKSQDDLLISFQDDSALKLIAQSGLVPSALVALKDSKDKNKLKWLKFSSPIVLTVLAVFVVPLITSFVPIKWLNGILSFEQERRLGRLILSTQSIVKTQNTAQSPQQKALFQLVQLLQKANPKLANIPFEIYIADQAEVNAFALPGAIIVFNKGLIDKAENLEEITGVLAHEMAHIERRHNLKSLVGGLGRLAGIGISALFLGSDASSIFAQGANFISLKYSREDESEADELGFEFLYQAKIDPNGIINFFSRLNQQDGNIEKLFVLASTHPASADRTQKINELLKNKNYKFENQFPIKLEDLK